NRALQIMAKNTAVAADCISRGVMTVPEARDADRLAFGSWTIEARVRVRDLDNDTALVGRKVFLLRRSFSTDDKIADNDAVELGASANYALGFTVAAGSNGYLSLVPFVSFKVADPASPQSIVNSPVEIPLVREDEESAYTLLKSDWVFLTGVYSAATQKLSLYIDGEFKDEKIVGGASSSFQCPTAIEGSTAYVKIGEHMVANQNTASGKEARLLVDEVRVWGVPNSTVHTRGGGYVTAFTRNAEEIAFGVSRSVYPVYGIYDPCLDYRYFTTTDRGGLLTGNPQTYVVDIRVDDHDEPIPLGTVGQGAGNLSYSDLNGNGQWDMGEYVWLDRNYKIVVDEEGNETREYSTSVNTYVYDEDYDVPLSPSTGWEDAEFTEEPGRVLQRVYYFDRDNSESISAEDYIWTEYDQEADNWYAAKYKRWAEAQGLALYLKFDDGGGSIEDYAWHADWRTTPKGWKHAARLTLPASYGVWPPQEKAVGGQINDGDYWFVTDYDPAGFAWVVDSSEAPSEPEVLIHTLANNQAGVSSEFCYVPALASTDFSRYDILSAVIARSSSDPESGSISYKYFWLYCADSTAELAAGDLKYEDGALRLLTDLEGDGSLSDDVLVGRDRELDLFLLKEKGLLISAGNVFQLAVVAVSSSGKNSAVVLQKVTVEYLNDEIPASLEYLSFTPNPGVEGSSFVVTLRNRAASAGTVYIQWFRNLNLSRTESKANIQPGAQVSFTLDPTLVKNGDTWSFKAYFEADNVAKSRSRAIPPTLDNANPESNGCEWVFRLVGLGYDEVDWEEDNANLSPTVPTSLVIKPFEPDINSHLVATASGSVDPEGDRFAYYYQWYRSEGDEGLFEAVEGQNQPYWQREVIVTTTTTTTTGGTTEGEGGEAGTGTTTTETTTTVTEYELNADDRLY
ncbi:MAG: hypothetical protein PHG30_09905, partial [Eubacteriales bacterium]|nr:hypothetical protein [Eubacteriales bacterium]